MSAHPSRLHRRRRLWLVCALFAGRWFADMIRDRRWAKCLNRIARLERELWEEFQVEAFRQIAPGITRVKVPEVNKIEMRPGARLPLYEHSYAGQAIDDGLAQALHAEGVGACPSCGHPLTHQLINPHTHSTRNIVSRCNGCRMQIVTPFHVTAGMEMSFDSHIRAVVRFHARRIRSLQAGSYGIAQLNQSGATAQTQALKYQQMQAAWYQRNMQSVRPQE